MQLSALLQTCRLGVKSLTLHKLRSTLTILGVVLGVSSVIVMLAIGEGARRDVVQQIQQLGARNIIIRSAKPADAGGGGESIGAIRYGLTLTDLRRIESGIPTVVESIPSREHRREFRYLGRHLRGRVVGVTPPHQRLNRLTLVRGRFISPLDVERATPVAVLSATVAESLFPLEDPLGQSVRIGEDQYYKVVGVTTTGGAVSGAGKQVFGRDYSRDVYIPFTTDQRRFGEVVSFDRSGGQLPEILEISQITVAVDEMQHVESTAEIVEAILREKHKQEDTAMTVPLELLERAEQTQRMLTLVLGSIASISLLVGGIGIMNIMLATVTERTREIGIRRALGARQRDITWQFVIETVVLSSMGGVIGLGVGVLVAWSLPHLFELNTIVRAWAPLLALTISVLIGVMFGAYPARRAARLDPIQALRHD